VLHLSIPLPTVYTRGIWEFLVGIGTGHLASRSTVLSFLSPSRDSSVGIVTRQRAGPSGVRIPEGERDVLFSKMSRPALGPTQPPVQRVPRFFFPGIAPGGGGEVIRSPRFSVEVKNEWPGIRFNGMGGEDLTIQGNSS